MLKVHVTQEEKTGSSGVGTHFAECFFWGEGGAAWDIFSAIQGCSLQIQTKILFLRLQ